MRPGRRGSAGGGTMNGTGLHCHRRFNGALGAAIVRPLHSAIMLRYQEPTGRHPL